MGLKEDYRLKKLIKEMHKLHCEVKKCCDGEGGDGLTCEDLENCQEIIDIKDSIPTDVSDLSDDEELLFSGNYDDLDNKPTIPTNNSELVNDSEYITCEDLGNCQTIKEIKESISDIPLFDCDDLDDCQTIKEIKESIPTNNSELVNDSGYLACEDLENCQEIIDIKDSIPTDVSDLSDANGILLEYKGEQSFSPLFPKKGWFYKDTGNGVMYYFDGANWIAYAEGGGGDIFIERSLPNLHTDISNNELVPGATYKITGVHKAHTVDSIPISALYDDGRDLGTTIFLKAISENELETFGSGIFYNPKYDKQVQGFGIWSSNASSYNINDIVFWGGYAWRNLNGNIGSSIDILNLNGEWGKLNYDDVNYNKVVDYIEYDIENDIITRRYDTVNEIDVSSGFFDIVFLGLDFSSVSLMQWGNDLYMDVSGFPSVTVGVGNIRVKHASFVELINFKGAFISNVTLDNGSRLQNVTFDNGSNLQNVTLDNQSRLGGVTFDGSSNVTFDNGSRLQNVTLDNGSRLQNVTLDNGSNLTYVTLDGSNLQNVTLDGSNLSSVTLDNGSNLQNVTLDNGSNLTYVTLDNGSGLGNVTFDNSFMRYNTFTNFGADFNHQTYSNLSISNIKFEGNGINYTIPYISNGVILIDPDIPQKKVFGIDTMTQKIQYWDSVNSNFAIADITD